MINCPNCDNTSRSQLVLSQNGNQIILQCKQCHSRYVAINSIDTIVIKTTKLKGAGRIDLADCPRCGARNNRIRKTRNSKLSMARDIQCQDCYCGFSVLTQFSQYIIKGLEQSNPNVNALLSMITPEYQRQLRMILTSSSTGGQA